MASIALTFAVLDVTGDAGALGLVLAARTIPLVLLILFGGALSDRFSRVTVVQVSNVAATLTQATLAILVITGSANLAWLLALSAMNGAVSAAANPALSSMLPELAPPGLLQQSNALISLSRNALTVVGPTVGALLVVTIGTGGALAIDAACWAISAILLIPVVMPARDMKAESTSVIRDMIEGWHYFRTTTWLWVVVVSFGITNIIHAGAVAVLGPAIAEDTIGRQGWGLVLSAEAIGLLAMTVVLLRIPLRRPLLWGMAGISLTAFFVAALGASPTLLVLVITAFIAGAGAEIFGLGWSVSMQEHVPNSMLSRAYSYDYIGSFVAIPIGQIMAAPLAASVGAAPLLIWSGVIYFVVCIITLMVPAVFKLDRKDPQAS